MEEEASPGDETRNVNRDIKAPEMVTKIMEATEVDNMVENLTNHPQRETPG